MLRLFNILLVALVTGCSTTAVSDTPETDILNGTSDDANSYIDCAKNSFHPKMTELPDDLVEFVNLKAAIEHLLEKDIEQRQAGLAYIKHLGSAWRSALDDYEFAAGLAGYRSINLDKQAECLMTVYNAGDSVNAYTFRTKNSYRSGILILRGGTIAAIATDTYEVE